MMTTKPVRSHTNIPNSALFVLSFQPSSITFCIVPVSANTGLARLANASLLSTMLVLLWHRLIYLDTPERVEGL